MRSFEDILSQKDAEIKKCEDFANFAKNIILSGENIEILLELLDEKINYYLNLKCFNYEAIALNLDMVDKNIIRQIQILKYDLKKDFSNLDEACQKYDMLYVLENNDLKSPEDIQNFILENEFFKEYLEKKYEEKDNKDTNKSIKGSSIYSHMFYFILLIIGWGGFLYLLFEKIN